MTDALIIIDMQAGSFGEDTPRFDAEGLVARLNSLARKVRARNGLVIFVQHDDPPGGVHAPGTPGWQILPGLQRHEDDISVRKTACDCFYNTGLEDLLRAHRATRLFITGCATDFCVDTTLRRATVKGFETWAPADGHTTADRPHLTAPQIIAHHNYVWADLITPSGPARVMSCADIMAGPLSES